MPKIDWLKIWIFHLGIAVMTLGVFFTCKIVLGMDDHPTIGILTVINSFFLATALAVTTYSISKGSLSIAQVGAVCTSGAFQVTVTFWVLF